MTVYRTVHLLCDAGLCREDEYDASDHTAIGVRSSARENGWHHVDGHDICPACWAAGARGPLQADSGESQ